LNLKLISNTWNFLEFSYIINFSFAMCNIQLIFFLKLILHLMCLILRIEISVLILKISHILSNIEILLKVLVLMICKAMRWPHSKDWLKRILNSNKLMVSVHSLSWSKKFSFYLIKNISLIESVLKLSLLIEQIIISKKWIS